MPMFVYQCYKCGFEEEKITKIDEKIKCKKCQGDTKRLFPNKVTHVLVGKGFHKTDYKD